MPSECCPAKHTKKRALQLLDHVTSEFKRIKRKQAAMLGLAAKDPIAGGRA